MKREILEYLICPACLPEENPLRLVSRTVSGEEISEGVLECDCCGQAYPIKRGIARLVALKDAGCRISGIANPVSVYESPEVLSAYLWSQYADLFADPDATGAYREWAAQILPAAGAALDAGCTVGRLCFEMSCKCDFVIGVDLSESFISTARLIMEQRKLSFQLKEEGRIQSERTFVLPEHWDSGKVEFVIADAGALPFRSGTFGCVASVNLVDKIARPSDHIYEATRTARPTGAQLLISDPFSWSEAVCAPTAWLGGASEGRFPGFGMDNIVGLLSRQQTNAWSIARTGAVWWKIRNHRNHFELIRSQFVKAER
ncbi:Methyltransferase type 11 [Syntrophobacter sp. SbD1]|nr:Methyltransferase type 11 [Syntrophobacter sp. SbD1]